MALTVQSNQPLHSRVLQALTPHVNPKVSVHNALQATFASKVLYSL